MPFFVYVLKHPVTDEIRYVGQTNDPVERFKYHLISTGKNHRVAWIRSVFNAGSCPKMEVIYWDIDTRERACLMEMQVIEALRARGTRLVNGTDGGESGEPGSIIHYVNIAKKKKKPKRRKHGPGRRRRKAK